MDQLVDFTSSLPAALQWLGVMLIGAIPFVESYLGSAIGVVVGIPAPLAIIAAIVGNAVCMLVLVLLTDTGRRKAVAVRAGKGAPTEADPDAAETRSRKKERVKKAFDRFGVPGVSLLGQWILPSQITSAMMVGFGASRNAVIVWQVVGITLWGVGFGVLAALGVNMLR